MHLEYFFQLDLFLQVRGITPGRAATLPASIMGLTSLVIGWIALARSAGPVNSTRLKAITALVAAMIAIVLSGRHLASATGALGSGSGRLGAIVAIVLAVIGMILAGLAFVRVRRIATLSNKVPVTGEDEQQNKEYRISAKPHRR